MLVVLGSVSKLRWEACEEISSSIALSAWDRMDIELTVVESLWFGFTTDGEVTVGDGCLGETIVGDVVVSVGGEWRKVKSSMGVRPNWIMQADAAQWEA